MHTIEAQEELEPARLAAPRGQAGRASAGRGGMGAVLPTRGSVESGATMVRVEEDEEDETTGDERQAWPRQLRDDPRGPPPGARGRLAMLCAVGLLLLALAGTGMDMLVWGVRQPTYYAGVLFVCGLAAAAMLSVRACIGWYVSRSDGVAGYNFLVFLALSISAHVYVSRFTGALNAGNQEFYLNQQVGNMLGGAFRSGGALDVKDIREMDELGDFWLWLQGPLMEALFCDEESRSPDNEQCYLADRKLRHNMVRLRTIRSAPRQCLYTELEDCAREHYYGSPDELRGTWDLDVNLTEHCPDRFVELQLQWQDDTYVSVSGATHRSVPSAGEGALYHRGGFWIDIFPGRSGDTEGIQQCFGYLQQSGFLDRFTRFVAVELHLVAPDLNAWHGAQMQFELFISGGIYVKLLQQHGSLPRSRVLSEKLPGFPAGPNVYCDDADQKGSILPIEQCEWANPMMHDSVGLGLLLYGIFGAYYSLLLALQLMEEGPRRTAADPVALVTLATVLMLWIGLGYEIAAQAATPYYDVEWFNFIELHRAQKQTLAFLLLVLWAQVIQYMSTFAWASVLTRALMRSVRDVLAFVVLFAAILVGFTLQFEVLFGASSIEFSTTPRAFYAMIRALTGDIDAQALFEFEPGLAFFVYSCYIVIMVFTLLTMLIAIINEHFLGVVMEAQQRAMDDGSSSTGTTRAGLVELGDSEATGAWLAHPEPGHINVVVERARGLRRNDSIQQGGRAVNAYVKVCILSRDEEPRRGAAYGFVTGVERGADAPSWDTTGTVRVGAQDDVLAFVVYDQDAVDVDSYLGEALVEVADVTPEARPARGVRLVLEDLRSVGRKLVSGYSVDGTLVISLCRGSISEEEGASAQQGSK